ncbi:MAG: hypothetical protein GF408_03500 [Candidatus Omnitrophica bacterium]|nr:hypothetical protein [Candidatus Omnitrophota bacterium]
MGIKRKIKTFTAAVLLLTFPSLVLSENCRLASGSSMPASNLSACSRFWEYDRRVFNSFELASILDYQARKDAGFIAGPVRSVDDAFMTVNGKNIQILFSEKQELRPSRADGGVLYTVPVVVDGVDKRLTIKMLEGRVYGTQLEESPGAETDEKYEVFPRGRDAGEKLYRIGDADGGLFLARKFMREYGLRNLAAYLDRMVSEGRILGSFGNKEVFSGEEVLYSDLEKGVEERASDLFEDLVKIEREQEGLSGEDIAQLAGLFREFLSAEPEGSRGEEAAQDPGPGKRILLRRLDGAFASNEGGIRLADEAYTEVTGFVLGVDIKECTEQKKDIVSIFRDVAMHDMEEHNRRYREGVENVNSLLKECERLREDSSGEGDSTSVDMIRGISRKTLLSLKDSGLNTVKDVLEAGFEKSERSAVRSGASREEKINSRTRSLLRIEGIGKGVYDPISREEMPGLKKGSIGFGYVSEGLVPTDKTWNLTREDGRIVINDNFVKLMHVLSLMGLKSGKGNIKDYDSSRGGDEKCSLYDSIIYSLAIHTLRGHHPVNEWGFAVFSPEEHIAQMQRGNRHLYTNLLAMMFYWLLLVEDCRHPIPRAREFMDEHPFIFERISPQSRNRLPIDLADLRGQLVIEGVRLFNPASVSTEREKEDIDRMMGEDPDIVSNDGHIWFGDKAYDHIWEIVDSVRMKDCRETVDFIKKAFREVAEHEVREHNEACERGEKERRITINDIKAADPYNIKVVSFDECLPPLDVTTADGKVYLNENFVKLMHAMGEEWMKSDVFGGIRKYPYSEHPNEVIGQLYSSIIYSFAIHTIRGHFPVNYLGYTIFQPDEKIAQGERGRSHLYVNLLAMTFYWVVLVERHTHPGHRAWYYMLKYPEIYRNLTDRERKMLPAHLLDFLIMLRKREALPFKAKVLRTKATRERVASMMERYPGHVSNDGDSTYSGSSHGVSLPEEKQWAYSVIEAFSSSRHSADNAGAGQKMVLAIETDWVPETQKGYIQQLSREIQALERFGAVKIIRANGGDLAAKVEEYAEKEKIPEKNIVVMAGAEALNEKYFRSIRAFGEDETDKAFIAEVDPVNLTEGSYVRILEMISMVMRMARGQEAMPHEQIERVDLNPRSVILIPMPSRVDPEVLREIYSIQRKILESA